MKVFIASSNDLKSERNELEVLLYRENFKPIVWENYNVPRKTNHLIQHSCFRFQMIR